MMMLSLVSQRTEEMVLKVEGHIHLPEEAGVLTCEGQRWLKQGKRVVLDLAGLQAIGTVGLAVLQWWAATGCQRRYFMKDPSSALISSRHRARLRLDEVKVLHRHLESRLAGWQVYATNAPRCA